jgi:pimeloyl-ACP methyl ester carboxylesterase
MLNSIKYILGILAILVILSAIAGIIYQEIATAQDESKYPPPGKLVDVGSYKLHLNCMGEGSPTVVMDYGLGGLSPLWSLVQPEVAKFARVCTYDRAGYAWSESSPTPRTSQNMVQELYTLLKNAKIPSPYVLVGHSLGGLNLSLFASQYPEEVAGLVLVDAVPPDVYDHLDPEFADSMNETGRMFGFLSLISRLGLLRFLLQIKGTSAAPDFVRKLPTEVQQVILAKFLPKTFATAIAENSLMATSAKQVQHTNFDPELPLVVLSHSKNMFTSLGRTKSDRAEQMWQKLQAELVNLSNQGKLIIAEGSSHDIHLDKPELVVNAIRQVIEKTKSNLQMNK